MKKKTDRYPIIWTVYHTILVIELLVLIVIQLIFLYRTF
jgi:hypothetical protein